MLNKYRPTAYKNNHNITKESHLAVLGKYIAVIFVILFGIFIIFEGVAYYAVNYMPLKKEAELFGDIDLGLGRTNPKQTEYVQKVLDKINPNDFKYKVQVVCDDDFNAFALMGGKIYILSGLLKKIDNENELSFVLAHEMSHIKNRDVMKQVISNMPVQIMYVLFAGAPVNVDGLNNAIRMPFSKEVEIKADTKALEIMHKKYDHVDGALSFLNKTDKEYLSFLTTFSDHPSTKSRKMNVQKIIKKNGYKNGEVVGVDKVLMGSCQ